MGMSEQDLNKPLTLNDLFAMAEQTPAQGDVSDDPYEAVRGSFASQFQLPTGMGAFSYAGPTRTQEGWQRIGAVFVNPSLGAQGILFPTSANGVNPAEVEGSEEWLQSIQDKWDDKKFNTWRKRLKDMGYDAAVTGGIADKGGKAQDVIDGLRAYWQTYYLNGGKAIPLRPVDQATREAVREQVDFKTLKAEMKTWGKVPFGEDLGDDEAEWLAEKMIRKMTELRKEHPTWTPEQVQAGAETRVMEKFTKDPQVAGLLQEQEDQEVSYKIRDSVVGVSQLLGA